MEAQNKEKETALHVASQMGHACIVACLIEKGASIEAKESSDETPLRIAINFSQTEVIRAILESKYWQKALETGTSSKSRETATQSLIRDFPEMAELVMDNCCFMENNECVIDANV